MKTLYFSCLTLICLFFGSTELNAQNEDPEWVQDLEFEFLTPRVLYSSLERPKLKVRVTNIGESAIEYMGFDFRPDGEPQNYPGCATFPNGGFVNLEPGESTIVSTWTACYFGDGLTLPEGTSTHTADFRFTQNNETYSLIEEFEIVNDEGRDSPSSPDGNDLTISGRIEIKGGYFPQVRLWAKTRHSLEMEIQTDPDGEGQLSFSFPAQEGYDWYLVTQADVEGEDIVNFPKQTISVNDFEDPEDIQIEIEALDYEYDVSFELRDAIATPTGFWRGSVSESEETVAFIPGQENWFGNSQEQEALKETATIYKYNFNGEKLWEYSPGYQCWGGDMARDGSKVLYQLVPNGGTYSIGMLDGFDGSVLWKHETNNLFPDGRPFEGLEARLSNDGNIAAIGVVSGFVSLYNANSGELIRQFPNGPNGEDTWGQVRSIMFDAADEHVYVGSGDNYLRKIRVANGEVIWKAFIGGWPFVNGLTMSSDESFIITGTKSFDQARVNNETGETEWINDSGSLEAALSLNDSLVINFGGMIMDAKTGDYVTSIRQGAEGHFFAGDTLVARVDRNVAPYYTNGKSLIGSEASGGGQGGGEQSQWSYMKPDGSLVIIAYRDMVTNPGNQIGIAFYTGNIVRNALDPNDSPTDLMITAESIDENNDAGATIGILTTVDEDKEDEFIYELIEGEGSDDNELFVIENDELIVTERLDFETRSAYNVRIRTSDSNEARYSKAFKITVNDVNDVPDEISLSELEIAENQDTGVEIGTLSTADQDANDSHTYSLVNGEGGDDNASFIIENGTLKSSTSFNFEEKNELSIRIQTDDGNEGTFTQTFTILVTDINDAPTALQLSNSNVEEDLDAGTEVGEFSSTDEDADETFTYVLVQGDGDTDNGSFEIIGNKLLTQEVFDFETKDNYTIRVSTTDSESASFESSFTISVDMVTDLEVLPELVEKVYPNPAQDELNFEISATHWPITVELLDTNGQLKLSHKQNENGPISLNISVLTAGVYLALIKDEQGHYTYKKVLVRQ